MNISERFALFLKEKELSQREFESRTGYLRQNLSNFLSGSTKLPRIDLIIALMTHFPELNLQWLLMGEGEIWKKEEISETEKERLEKLEKENERLQEELMLAKNETIQAKEEIIRLLKQQTEK